MASDAIGTIRRVDLDARIADALAPILDDPDQVEEFARQLGDLIEALACLPGNDEVDIRIAARMRGVVRQLETDGGRRYRLPTESRGATARPG